MTKAARKITQTIVLAPVKDKLSRTDLALASLQRNVEVGHNASKALIERMTKRPTVMADVTYAISWSEDSLVSMEEGSLVEMILNNVSELVAAPYAMAVKGLDQMPTEDSDKKILTRALYDTLQHAKARCTEELLKNRYRGTSSSQISNAVEHAKREATSRVLDKITWILKDLEAEVQS